MTYIRQILENNPQLLHFRHLNRCLGHISTSWLLHRHSAAVSGAHAAYDISYWKSSQQRSSQEYHKRLLGDANIPLTWHFIHANTKQFIQCVGWIFGESRTSDALHSMSCECSGLAFCRLPTNLGAHIFVYTFSQKRANSVRPHPILRAICYAISKTHDIGSAHETYSFRLQFSVWFATDLIGIYRVLRPFHKRTARRYGEKTLDYYLYIPIYSCFPVCCICSEMYLKQNAHVTATTRYLWQITFEVDIGNMY